jgi:hypothetical protein
MMPENRPSTRRQFLAGSVMAGTAASFITSAPSEAAGLIADQADGGGGAAHGDAIRPFRFRAPESSLVDLRRRITATQWPERETVSDASQGVQLATMRKVADYWRTAYDWRKCETRLNAFPQFVTEID